MSNIPPEPPDPPIISSALTSNNPESSQTGSRRSKGRGRNVAGHVEKGRGDSALSGASVSVPRGQRPRGQRDSRGKPQAALGSGGVRSFNADEVQGADGSAPRPQESTSGPSRRRRNRKPNEGSDGTRSTNILVPDSQSTSKAVGVPPAKAARATAIQGRPRRDRFGSHLTEQHNIGPSSSTRRRQSPPPNSDLTTRLIHTLGKPPYPDCPICFNALHPAQPIWSCSLSDEASSCCWASFHLRCVREWARKSTTETRAAFRARGEERDGEWRCPGCQAKRTQVPQTYLCFCRAVTDPQPGIATPHSCGLPCSRRRVTCEHPCPLSCHPGPCPPCILTVQPPCHCTKTILSVRCAHFHAQPPPPLSCGQMCMRPLSCGNHVCEKECHPGECGACEMKEHVRCYCGKNAKQVDCGEGRVDKQECCLVTVEGDKSVWEGRFDCGNSCERSFACGHHACTKTCHPPSPTPALCPFDPSTVKCCPCGKHNLHQLSETSRMKCTDTIPTCTSSCGKALEGCLHRCSTRCHVGICPPCTVPVTVPCRCGMTTCFIPCHQRQRDISQGREVILCERVCGVARLCGRHQCARVCCPLSITQTRGKGKRGKASLQQTLTDAEVGSTEILWHECDLVCGKLLGCGSHRCAEPDHRGPCPPCLQSSFDELICRCGRSVIFPPVPCGTRINCPYSCDRPPPPCGHGRTTHTCHEDHAECPPCPFLTNKRCACGKSNISNVRCSQEKVSCGQACGKLLDCGFHRCQRLCHGDDCGVCSSVCGKPRKLCLPAHHPCPLPCHAPSVCNESEPCGATLNVSCPCGRFKQPMRCGRCISNPAKAIPQLQCTDSCAVAKRNARLADALGISPETKDKSNVVYAEDLLAFGRANLKFVLLVEKALNDFVTSDKKTHVLPYMPETRRKFVRDLCQLYRVDTTLVDQEPQRSIQIHRRVDTRTPSPLLSAFVASQNAIPNLGKLADLRASTPVSRAAPAAPRPPIGTSTRGWTSAATSASQATTSANPWSSGMPRVLADSATSRPSNYGTSSDVRQNWEED